MGKWEWDPAGRCGQPGARALLQGLYPKNIHGKVMENPWELQPQIHGKSMESGNEIPKFMEKREWDPEMYGKPGNGVPGQSQYLWDQLQMVPKLRDGSDSPTLEAKPGWRIPTGTPKLPKGQEFWAKKGNFGIKPGNFGVKKGNFLAKTRFLGVKRGNFGLNLGIFGLKMGNFWLKRGIFG